MYKVGDIVSYESGDGIFQGEVLNVNDEDVLTVKTEEEVFFLPISEILEDGDKNAI